MGKVGLGTTIKVVGVGSGASDVVVGVESIGGPNWSADMEETTNLGSTDGWEEYIAGVLRSGEVNLTINWDPIIHDAFVTAMASRDTKACTIEWSGGGSVGFNAYVQNVNPTAPTGKMTGTITLKPTGKPTSGIGSA